MTFNGSCSIMLIHPIISLWGHILRAAQRINLAWESTGQTLWLISSQPGHAPSLCWAAGRVYNYRHPGAPHSLRLSQLFLPSCSLWAVRWFCGRDFLDVTPTL